MTQSTILSTQLITIPAFAKVAGLTDDLARRLVKRGDIPSVRVGTRRRIEQRWAEKWLMSGQEPQPVPSVRGGAYEAHDG